MDEFPDGDRSRGILRKSMMLSFLENLPYNPEEFRSLIPLRLREGTDSRQLKYLDSIFEILEQVNADKN
jgi:hypothetical protein